MNNQNLAIETIDAMREKHLPVSQHQGAIGDTTYCTGCKTTNGVLAVVWPCDVVQVLNACEPAFRPTCDFWAHDSTQMHAEWYRFCPRCGGPL